MSVLFVVLSVVQLVVLIKILAALRGDSYMAAPDPLHEIHGIRRSTVDAMFAAEAAARRQP